MAVAVSGGADSFALLHVLHEKNIPVVCLTVDHGLRPEAADEAARVARWCADRGIPHETLVWDPESAGNLQANARAARYRLLCEACNRLGIETLVTGHTADDQAETVFMRLRRGSGRGLAAMPEMRLIAGGAGEPVTLYRPLLGIRRAQTQAYAEAHGLPVSRDPSNEDERFERVRIRALLAALEQQDLLTVEALCRTAGEIGALESLSSGAVLRDLAKPAFRDQADGAVMIWDQPDQDEAAVAEAVERSIASVGDPNFAFSRRSGRSACRGPAPDKAENAEAGTRQAPCRLAGMTVPTTVGGAQIRWGRAGELLIFREPAALLGRSDGAGGFDPVPLLPGEKHLFDRRFIVHVPEEIAAGADLRPLGALMPRDIATSTLDRQRVSTLPCFSLDGRLSHVPAACHEMICKSLAGWKQADAFLNGVKTFEAVSLLEERFSGRVIRF